MKDKRVIGSILLLYADGDIYLRPTESSRGEDVPRGDRETWAALPEHLMTIYHTMIMMPYHTEIKDLNGYRVVHGTWERDIVGNGKTSRIFIYNLTQADIDLLTPHFGHCPNEGEYGENDYHQIRRTIWTSS